jgi:hypothetical protein
VDPEASASTTEMRAALIRETAEIVSKAPLLARDHEIKDPTILEQLRA